VVLFFCSCPQKKNNGKREGRKGKAEWGRTEGERQHLTVKINGCVVGEGDGDGDRESILTNNQGTN